MPLARLSVAIVSVFVMVLACIQLWSPLRTGRPRWRPRRALARPDHPRAFGFNVAAYVIGSVASMALMIALLAG
jgi:hypothetical protein